ncbi:hypothetical protein PR048_024387 [Dryococelus australis]|uniref:Uncharacterized protein n=1 Tax=Dryococelus australis TaxID=614101 RepID=A0ABQ9GNJ6_9NEOP|nr:hypothetical protein PR048_024387 [Dryococelus australis]
MEQHRNVRAGGGREIPRKPAAERHDSHLQKSGMTRPGIEPGSARWEASTLTGVLLLAPGRSRTAAATIIHDDPASTVTGVKPHELLQHEAPISFIAVTEAARVMAGEGWGGGGGGAISAAVPSYPPRIAVAVGPPEIPDKVVSQAFLLAPVHRTRNYRARTPTTSTSEKISLDLPAFWGRVAERLLARSPPTKVNRVQSPAGSPDFGMWESCRTMPLACKLSRESPAFPALSFRRCPILTSITVIGSQDLATFSPIGAQQQGSDSGQRIKCFVVSSASSYHVLRRIKCFVVSRASSYQVLRRIKCFVVSRASSYQVLRRITCFVVSSASSYQVLRRIKCFVVSSAVVPVRVPWLRHEAHCNDGVTAGPGGEGRCTAVFVCAQSGRTLLVMTNAHWRSRRFGSHRVDILIFTSVGATRGAKKLLGRSNPTAEMCFSRHAPGNSAPINEHMTIVSLNHVHATQKGIDFCFYVYAAANGQTTPARWQSADFRQPDAVECSPTGYGMRHHFQSQWRVTGSCSESPNYTADVTVCGVWPARVRKQFGFCSEEATTETFY